jgi:hypothetical protein
MKRFHLILAAVACLLVAGLAIAGVVYDRQTGTISTSTATLTVTPPAKYAGVVLKKVWMSGAPVTNCNLIVYRWIDSDTVIQEVARVEAGTALYGAGVPAQYAAIKSGESFYVTNTVLTNATVWIDYEVQTHD